MLKQFALLLKRNYQSKVNVKNSTLKRKINFIAPIRSLFKYLFTQLKIRGKNLIVGKNLTLKANSRIKSWIGIGHIRIGNDVSIGYNSELYVWNGEIQIGHNTSLNDNCKIYENVKIGSGCLFASNIFISSGSHSIKNSQTLPIKSQDKLFPTDQGIIIEDDCWIGFGVVIMPGVYIGKGAVIGANSVVTKNVFPYSIHAGVPAREIGKRLEFDFSYLKINSFDKLHWPFFYRGVDYSQFDRVDSLKDGLDISLETAVFLLKKIDFLEFNMSGTCMQKTLFRVIINGALAIEMEIDEGEFEINQKIDTSVFSYGHELDFSQEIVNLFNVISVVTNPKMAIENRREARWKVRSVKIS